MLQSKKKARAWRKKALRLYYDKLTDSQIARECKVPIKAVAELRAVYFLSPNGEQCTRKFDMEKAWELFRKGTPALHAAEKLGCSHSRVKKLFAHMRNS